MSQRAMIRVITAQVSEHTLGQVLAPPSKNRHIFVPLPTCSNMLMIQQSASVGRKSVTCSTEPLIATLSSYVCHMIPSSKFTVEFVGLQGRLQTEG